MSSTHRGRSSAIYSIRPTVQLRERNLISRHRPSRVRLGKLDQEIRATAYEFNFNTFRDLSIVYISLFSTNHSIKITAFRNFGKDMIFAFCAYTNNHFRVQIFTINMIIYYALIKTTHLNLHAEYIFEIIIINMTSISRRVSFSVI